MNARPYAEGIKKVHASILARMGEASGPLFEQQSGKILLVVVAGDKGLCGSFNANIFKRAKRVIQEHGHDRVTILPVGKKAVSQYLAYPGERLKGYDGIFRNVTLQFGEELTQRLVDAYCGGGYEKVMVLYNMFKNVLVQEATLTTVLPLSGEIEEEQEGGPEHLAEPSLEEILEELSPRVVMTQVFQAVLESCASEHAARMTAMDAATKNAKEMIEKLTLEMNKARQAAITKELIEVVSGAAAL